jgi:hypothetical protein
VHHIPPLRSTSPEEVIAKGGGRGLPFLGSPARSVGRTRRNPISAGWPVELVQLVVHPELSRRVRERRLAGGAEGSGTRADSGSRWLSRPEATSSTGGPVNAVLNSASNKCSPTDTTGVPDFETKAADVIGLYVNPPQHAAIFSVDESRRSRPSIAPFQHCPSPPAATNGMGSNTSAAARSRCMPRSTREPVR